MLYVLKTGKNVSKGQIRHVSVLQLFNTDGNLITFSKLQVRILESVFVIGYLKYIKSNQY